MKSLLLEEITQLFPTLNPESLEELYTRPFKPEQILIFFKGWEFYEPYSRYIDNSEERNIVWFEESHYIINGQQFCLPDTLGDFMEDCRSLQIELFWNNTIASFWKGVIADNLLAN